MFETLRIRREALEHTLADRLAELKAICIQEAEITGTLPPETPLKPNEPPPVIRRRMRTEFSLDKLNSLNQPRSVDEQHLAQLELELEIQSKIVAASLKLKNEAGANGKKASKKREQAYSEALDKLRKLESKLIPMKNHVDESRRSRARKKDSFDQLPPLPLDQVDHVGGENQPPNSISQPSAVKKRLKAIDDNPMHQQPSSFSVPPSPSHRSSYRGQALAQLASQLAPQLRNQLQPPNTGHSYDHNQRPLPWAPSLRQQEAVQGPHSMSTTAIAAVDVNVHSTLQSATTSKSVQFLSIASDQDISEGNRLPSQPNHHQQQPLKGILINNSGDNVHYRDGGDKVRYRPATAVGLPIAGATSDSYEALNEISASAAAENMNLYNSSAYKADGQRHVSGSRLVRTNSLDNDLRRRPYASYHNHSSSVVGQPAQQLQQDSSHDFSTASLMPNMSTWSLKNKILSRNPPPPPSAVPPSITQRPLPPPPIQQQEQQTMPAPPPPTPPRKIHQPIPQRHLPPPPPPLFDAEPMQLPPAEQVAVVCSSESLSRSSSFNQNHHHQPYPQQHLHRDANGPLSRTAEDDALMRSNSLSRATRAAPPPAPKEQPPVPDQRSIEVPNQSRAASKLPPSQEATLVRTPTKKRPEQIQATAVDNSTAVGDFQSTQSASIRSDSAQLVSIPVAPTVIPSGAHFDVLEFGQVRPGREEVKPFEMSDFYKYSAKLRNSRNQMAQQPSSSSSASLNNNPVQHSHGSASTSLQNSDHLNCNVAMSQAVSPQEPIRSDPLSPPPAGGLNDSFLSRATVADDFQQEMLEWYDENLANVNNPTVI